MIDTAFDDFLDSDDDDFLLEASRQILDCDSATESIQTAVKNDSQEQSKVTSSLSNNTISLKAQSVPSDSDKISSNKSRDIIKNIYLPNPSSSSNSLNSLDFTKIHANKYEDDIKVLNESKNTVKSPFFSPLISSGKNDKNTNVSSTGLASITEKNVSPVSFSPSKEISITPNSSYINSRFTPGFTPKAKRQKLPGPAGLLDLFNRSKDAALDSSEGTVGVDMEFENITSSQFAPEHLSSVSWQKLQTAVSSCPNLHSIVKYYSIQRVLQESSKKKLPKHMVVPLLCVLLKQLSCKGSTTISVFMDDTGEINGKIDMEVFSKYKEYLVQGTAFILKNVTFLCNVLILKVENLVSVYHPDGLEKHPENLDSILKTPEPLKPMNCECLKLPNHSATDKQKVPPNNIASVNHKLGCVSHTQTKHSNSTSDQQRHLPKKPCYQSTPQSNNRHRSNTVSNLNQVMNENMRYLKSGSSVDLSETSNHVKSGRNDAFLENLLDEENCVDEFDELLGNLDEKSFMEDL